MKTELKKPLIFGGALILIFVLIALFVTYVFRVDSPVSRAVQKVLPMPAAIVGWSLVPVADVETRVDAVRYFHENQDFAKHGVRIDFTTSDGQKREQLIRREVLNKAIENTVIRELAADAGLIVSSEELEKATDSLRQENDEGESSVDVYARRYGWTPYDLAEHVVLPELYRQKVENDFYKSNPASGAQRQKIDAAYAAAAGGQDFADVAKEYSEGLVGPDGGRVGLLSRATLDPILEEVVYGLSIGEISTVTETPTGLHIFRLEGIQEDPLSGEELRDLSHIVVNKTTFSDFLDQIIGELDVRVYLPGFMWDPATRFSVFEDPAMRAFEQAQIEASNLELDI